LQILVFWTLFVLYYLKVTKFVKLAYIGILKDFRVL